MSDASKVALIIGVDDYYHKRIDGTQSLVSLPSCKKDALDLYELLKYYRYTIFLGAPILGSSLTEGEGFKRIQQAIKDFFYTAEAGQTLLLYFSGHGITNRGQVFLGTPEVDPQNPIFIGINLRDLTDLINDSSSTRIVGVIDACYSGAASLPNSKGIVKVAAERDADEAIGIYDKINENVPIAEGKCLLLSSQAYQRSQAEANNNSVYTKYLIEGLKGATASTDEKGLPIPPSIDEHGNVTPQTLHDYVYNRVANELKTQTPRIKSSLSSKIILATHPELAAEVLGQEKSSSDFIFNLAFNGKVTEFNDLRSQNYYQQINFYARNLDNKDLPNTNFSYIDLTKASLSQTNLTGANLTGANLTGANLYHANLSKTNLTKANLSQTNLIGAKLNEASLTEANLHKANLTGASLLASNVDKADFSEANLYFTDLSNVENLDNANLQGADLRKVKHLPISKGKARSKGAYIQRLVLL